MSCDTEQLGFPVIFGVRGGPDAHHVEEFYLLKGTAKQHREAGGVRIRVTSRRTPPRALALEKLINRHVSHISTDSSAGDVDQQECADLI